MKVPTNELLLALRSPRSGWLATMVCALEEAMRDADFSENHRDLLRQLLDGAAIPAQVAIAAEARLSSFEQDVAEAQAGLAVGLFEPMAAAQPTRPKLTLVSNAA
jgi:hypothetical protein